MIRLVFSDLRDHAATWIGSFVIAVACGYIGGWAASIEATSATYENLRNLSSAVLVFSLLAAVPVLASTANLTVSAQRRSYALWQLANVSPRRVSRVVLAQLVVVAVLGAVCGTLFEAATLGSLFPLVFSSREVFAQVVPQVGVSAMPAVWLAVAGVFLCGGLKGARSAGRTPPITALRESEPKRRGMTWLRGLLFAGLAICTCWVASLMLASGPDAVMNWSLYLPILVVATLVPLAPLLFSVLLAAWTSFVPWAHRDAWYLARHTARYGLSTSTSVETPLMVGFGLVAGIFSIIMCGAVYAQSQGVLDFNGLDMTTTLLLLGGPLLLCALGAAVSVVMTSRSRTHDVALLIAAGARPETLLAAAACEAIIHVVTATLVGVVAVIISNAIVAYAYGLPLFTGLVFGEGIVVSLVGFVLVLVATLVPTCVALSRETATVLTAQE